MVQSARNDAVIASYERAFKDKSSKDEVVQPHHLEAGQWVLVRHETHRSLSANGMVLIRLSKG
jgi:hypothetical protein